MPKKWQGNSFSVAVTVFLGILFLFLFFYPYLSIASLSGLSLVCGGILSNMLDRLVMGGYVVDFLNFGWGCFRSSIFNVADAAIVVGSGLFLLRLLLELGSRIFGKLLNSAASV
jgi:signal peptidase II